jgi:hypothetical protein
MKELARRRGFYDNIKWSPKNSVVRERVTKWLEKVEYPHLVDEEEEEPVCQGEDGYLAEFMVSSYLRPQKKGDEEGQNKYTVHGHRAERPFMKKFYDLFSSGGRQSTAENEGSTHPGSDVKIEAIYSPGLVYNKTRRGLRADSPGKRVGTVTAVVAPNPMALLKSCWHCSRVREQLALLKRACSRVREQLALLKRAVGTAQESCWHCSRELLALLKRAVGTAQAQESCWNCSKC